MQNRVKYYDRHSSGCPDENRTATDTSEKNTDEPMVDAARLLEVLFEDGSSRPTLRWIRKMQSQRKIPYYKIGHLVRFRVSEVQEALSQKCHVRAA
jgi:excisionase family DNA binding protein